MGLAEAVKCHPEHLQAAGAWGCGGWCSENIPAHRLQGWMYISRVTQIGKRPRGWWEGLSPRPGHTQGRDDFYIFVVFCFPSPGLSCCSLNWMRNEEVCVGRVEERDVLGWCVLGGQRNLTVPVWFCEYLISPGVPTCLRAGGAGADGHWH